MGPTGVARAMEEALQGHEEVWYIVSEAVLWDARGLVQEWFADNAALLGNRSFARVDVYLYSLASVEIASRGEVQ